MASEELQALLARATTASQAGDKATAIACLQEVVSLNPKYEAAWIGLGWLLSDPQQAITCLQNALAINPDNPEAHRRLTWWQKQLAAQSAERQAANEHITRAKHFKDAGQIMEAIEESCLSTSLDASLTDGWNVLGTACQQLGWSHEAAYAYRRALRREPNNSLVRQALDSIPAAPSRAGSLLWSVELAEKEAGNFCVSPNGQRLLVASGGAALPNAPPREHESGYVHLIDRCGNVQTLPRDWKIGQAGLSENGALAYVTQAAKTGALVTWIDPLDPATPVMQHRMQAGPPIVLKCPNDMLIATSTGDPITAIDMDGNIVWQTPHYACTTIRLDPTADRHALVSTAETLRSFANEAEVQMISMTGQIMWRKIYPNWLSTTLLEGGLRTLVATARSLEAINQQGNFIWQRTYRDIIAIHLSPDKDILLVQHERGATLDALNTWSGQAIWQRTNLSNVSVGFVNLNTMLVLVLRDSQERIGRKIWIEAMDAPHGNTVWKHDLSQYGLGSGQVITAGAGWAAVLLGQTLVTLDKNGLATGSYRFLGKNISVWPAPQPPNANQPVRELLAIETNRRIMALDQSARPVWEQAIACHDWRAIPRSPYIAVLGTKGRERHTLSMLRIE